MKPMIKNLLVLAATIALAPALNAGPAFDFTAGVTKLLIATSITTAGWMYGPPINSIQRDLSSENNKLNGFGKALYYPGFLLLSNIVSNSSKKSFSKACSRSSFFRRCYHVGTGVLTLALLAKFIAPERENNPGLNPFAEPTVPRQLEASVNAIWQHLSLMWAVELASTAADSFSKALSAEAESTDF